MVPNPALVDRFRTDLDALIEPGARFGVAVSGGPDSLALLLLAAAARPGDLEAATVDHGLRPESRAEAEQVADICQRLGVPHSILAIEWDLPPASAIQEQARAVRYGALAQWMRERGLTALLTGASSGRPGRDFADAAQPRLGCARPCRHASPEPRSRRSRTHAASAVARLAATGTRGHLRSGRPRTRRRSEQFRRAPRARPGPPGVCDKADWLDPQALARSAENLASADEALDWAADREWAEFVDAWRRGDRLSRFDRADGDHSPHRRPGDCRTGTEGAPDELRGRELDRLIADLQGCRTTTLRGVRCTGGVDWKFDRSSTTSNLSSALELTEP